MLTFPPDLPELMQTLAGVTYECLLQRGIDDDAAAEIALAAADEVRTVFGGQELYITRGTWLLTERDREIFAAFNGKNEVILARRYELTVRRIQQIVARVRAEMIKDRQGALAL